MSALGNRLSQLESASPANPVRWHDVAQNSDWGETKRRRSPPTRQSMD
jgi:hypothetical protein